MAVATKNPPKSETLSAALASERRQLRDTARAEIIRAYLSDSPLSHDVNDLLDSLALEGLARDRFVGEARTIASNQRLAGSASEREAADKRLADAEAAADDELSGVDALQREIAALNARLVGLERGVKDARAEVERRAKAVADLRSIAANDSETSREYHDRLKRLRFDDLQLKPRVAEIEALLRVNDPDMRRLHAHALLRHERDDLRAWGEKFFPNRRIDPLDNRCDLSQWGAYIREREAELADIRPRVEAAQAEHARALETLREDCLSAFVPK